MFKRITLVTFFSLDEHHCVASLKEVKWDYMIKTSHLTKKRNISEYTAVFQEENQGGFSVWVPDLPGCASQGETFEDALINIKEAIELYLEETKETVSSSSSYKKQFIVPVQIYA